MTAKIRTVVTFESSLFNTSDPKDYFINPCCFGDDVAIWLAEQLRAKGYEAEGKPGQEDFGWYFTFRISGIEDCFVIGHRPTGEEEVGVWIGGLERGRGLVASLLGRRKRGIEMVAAQAIHQILSRSPQIWNIRWHFERDFNGGHQKSGAPQPA
jgi:hypothetical protein